MKVRQVLYRLSLVLEHLPCCRLPKLTAFSIYYLKSLTSVLPNVVFYHLIMAIRRLSCKTKLRIQGVWVVRVGTVTD